MSVFFSQLSHSQDLSLTDAIQMGMKNNYQIQISNERIALAKMNNSWGAAGLWPSLDFSLSNSNNLNDQDNPASFINGQFSSSSLRGALDLNWTLFNGFKVKATKEKLADLQEQSEGNAQLVIENSVQSIILSYYRLKTEQEKLEMLQKSLDLSSSKFKYYKEKLEMGVNTSFQFNQFKSNLLSDSVNYLMQEQAVMNARKNLNLVLAVTEDAKFKLTDPLAISVIDAPYSDLENKLINSNSNLKNQYLNNAILKKDIQIQKSSTYPVISFGSGANRTDNWFEFDGDKRNGNAMNYYANFTLSYRLFNGGNIKRSIKNAEIQYGIDEITTKEIEFSLKQDLRNYYDVLSTQLRIYQLNRENESVNAENLKIAEQKLDQGSITTFEFRELQLTELRTSITRIESTFQYIQNHLEVLKLTGEILN
jgi:outer membrane protein TolC